MKVIVGLGNPGEKYKNNRHNVGQMLIDYLKSQNLKLKTNIQMVKTDVFMNQSGPFIEKVLKNRGLDIDDLIIVHDDLDIPLGKFKIQWGEGPRLHNGLKSIEETLNTGDFWRIRIGVDARTPEDWIDGEAYVLSDFEKNEREIVDSTFESIVVRLSQQKFINQG